MPAMTRTRWWILTLLFCITTINYLDRIVLSVLIPVIREDLHITTEQYGYVTGAFQLAYTLGFLFMGRLIDRYGTRFGYARRHRVLVRRGHVARAGAFDCLSGILARHAGARRGG